MAPIAASAALLGGYLIIKFFPQLSLQVLFNAYFGLLGSVAVAGAFQGPLRQLVIFLCCCPTLKFANMCVCNSTCSALESRELSCLSVQCRCLVLQSSSPAVSRSLLLSVCNPLWREAQLGRTGSCCDLALQTVMLRLCRDMTLPCSWLAPVNRLLACAQATALGQEVRLPLPRGLVKDESGKDLADEGITASDIAALLIGIAAASADVLCGHSNFTLNNLLACLIAVDLLGVRHLLESISSVPCMWLAALSGLCRYFASFCIPDQPRQAA